MPNARRVMHDINESSLGPTYKTCCKCNAMMIQDSRGGLVCINHSTHNTEVDFSGQHNLTDASR